MATTTPITEAPAMSTSAAIREDMRTKNPTTRETRLSSSALILSSKALPGLVIILFQGEKSVVKSIEIEKESSIFFTSPIPP
jgi:hypothetical protein